MRGTFANIRIKNEMVPGVEGGISKHYPSGESMPIYDAAMRYKADGTPLVVIGGKEYGTGSSRDWAAKGTILLGVRAVIAESFERIHRSNLVGMGVLPLQFKDGETRTDARPDRRRDLRHPGRGRPLSPRKMMDVVITRADGTQVKTSGAVPRSIPRTRWNITATAAFCITCCAGWPRRPDVGGPGDGPLIAWQGPRGRRAHAGARSARVARFVVAGLKSTVECFGR